MKERARRPRWRDDNRDGICDRCQVFLDDCQCVCQYCGQTTKCECAIGLMIATGGG